MATRKRNGHRWRTLQTRVYADEERCALCGQRVDKTLPRKNPDGTDNLLSKSVDHIVPIKHGGAEYDRANLQLAHLGCNFRKNDGRSTKRTVRILPEVIASDLW